MTAQEKFDMFGNAPDLWFDSAMNLLMASAEISRASSETAKNFSVPCPWTRSFWPRLMLRAFAIECLIKAHYLKSKGKLCVGGKLIGIVKTHDLINLARRASIAISDVEADLLERLSAVAVGVGRYPIFTSFDLPKKSGSSEGLRINWSHPTDDRTFDSLLRRLVMPFDQQSDFENVLKGA